ncbi:MAG: hypothetical protein J6Q61_06615 [Bacteroidales bacterium]|nr:hypothetical protein [Bacteroidales bacterium]
MPIWLGITIAILCLSLGCGLGVFVTTLGVISREKKAVRDGYVEIDGKNYILGEIIRKGGVVK